MVATGEIISKKHLVDGFNTKVQAIINAINLNSSMSITFQGSAGTGSNVLSPSGYITNPAAIPSGQLGNTLPQTISENQLSSIVNATEIYNLFYSMIAITTKIRQCNMNWYHQINAADNLINSQTRIANFAESTTAVSGSTKPFFVKNPNITNMLSVLDLNKDNCSSTLIITADRVNALLNELYSKWDTFKSANAITYTYYTCHHNCHSNYSDRARR